MNGLDRSANKLSSESLVFAMNQNTIPKISVMIPCYNNSAFIEQAIRSVLDQKVDADVELVMIDDASTDSSVSIIESLCDARIDRKSVV
jgi:glycosyltransferase involved in cell wall biosynthesis